MGRRKRNAFFLAATGCVALAGVTAVALPAAEKPEPKELYETARQRYARIDSSIARLTWHETVKGKRRPEEVILLKVRESPWSVYAKWLGKEGAGREGVYVRGQYRDKVHVRLAAGDVPFMPAGALMALDPNGSLLWVASTHPITELGVGAAIGMIGEVVAALERGDRRQGTLTVVGPQRREEFGKPVLGIEHRIPAGADAAVRDGGRRTYWFDPSTGLPTLIVTHDEKGREVEYYHYDRLQLSVRLDDEDFDPERLWGVRRR